MDHLDPKTCEQFLMQFPDVEGGELSALPLQRFEAHISACAGCKKAWLGFQEAVLAAETALKGGSPTPPDGAPEDYWDTFLPRLRARMEPPAKTAVRSRRPVWALPTAAALVLGFCLGAFTGATSQNAGPIQTASQLSVEPLDFDFETDMQEDLYLPLTGAEESGYDATYDLVDSLDEAEIDLLVDDLLGEIS